MASCAYRHPNHIRLHRMPSDQCGLSNAVRAYSISQSLLAIPERVRSSTRNQRAWTHSRYSRTRAGYGGNRSIFRVLCVGPALEHQR